MCRIYWVDRAIAISFSILTLSGGWSGISYAQTLPPPQEVPEEVLRAEIYTEARSPVDGRLLTAAEYIEESERLQSLNIPPRYLVSEKVQRLIELLKLRKLIRQVIPFI